MRFIFCADLHFSDKQPTSHIASDWFGFQRAQLERLNALQKTYGCPVLCAGDIFHRPTVSIELLNMVIDHLPRPFYCIPGQHDLPYHSEEQLEKSAYYNLVKHEGIYDVSNGPEILYNPDTGLEDTRLIGMPFGRDYPDRNSIGMVGDGDDIEHDVLLAHRYCYIPDASPIPLDKVSEEDHAKAHYKRVKGYQLALYGDNHAGFQTKNIINCGTFMQRNADDAFGQVWLIDAFWNAEPYILQEETLVRKVEHKEKGTEPDFDCSNYIEALKETNGAFDFHQAVQTYMKVNNVSAEVRKTTFDIIDQCKATGAKGI